MLIKPLVSGASRRTRTRIRSNLFDVPIDGQPMISVDCLTDVVEMPNSYEAAELSFTNVKIESRFGLQYQEVMHDEEPSAALADLSSQVKSLVSQRRAVYPNYKESLQRYYSYIKEKYTTTRNLRITRRQFVKVERKTRFVDGHIKVTIPATQVTLRRPGSFTYQGEINGVRFYCDLKHGRYYRYRRGQDDYVLVNNGEFAHADLNSKVLEDMVARGEFNLREPFSSIFLDIKSGDREFEGDPEVKLVSIHYTPNSEYWAVPRRDDKGFISKKHILSYDVDVHARFIGVELVGGYMRRRFVRIRHARRTDYPAVRREYQRIKAALWRSAQAELARLATEIQIARGRMLRLAKATYHSAQGAVKRALVDATTKGMVYHPRCLATILRTSSKSQYDTRFGRAVTVALPSVHVNVTQYLKIDEDHGAICDHIIVTPEFFKDTWDIQDTAVARVPFILQATGLSVDAPTERELVSAVRSAELAIRSGRLNENYDFLLARSIAELKDLPETGRQALDFLRFLRGVAQGRYSSVLKAQGIARPIKATLSALASAYLGWKFAIQPTISDIETVVSQSREYLLVVNKSLMELLRSLVSNDRNYITARKAFRVGPKVGEYTATDVAETRVKYEYRTVRRYVILSQRDRPLADEVVRSHGLDPAQYEVMISNKSISDWDWAEMAQFVLTNTYLFVNDNAMGRVHPAHALSPGTTFDDVIEHSVEHCLSLIDEALLGLSGSRLNVDLRCYSRYKGSVFARFTPRELYDRVTDLSTLQRLMQSIQPALLAWELTPLSFVADWLTSTRRCAHAINDALMAVAIPYAVSKRFWASIRSELLLALPDVELRPANWSTTVSDDRSRSITYVTLETSGRGRYVKTQLHRFNRGPIVDWEISDVFSMFPSLQVSLNASKLATLSAMFGPGMLP